MFRERLRWLSVLIGLIVVTSAASAKVVSQDVEYKDGDTVLKGFLAYDDAVTNPAPGVLICHQWMGLSDHERATAEALAEAGYVAFACDIYGVDNRPSDRQAAGKIAGGFKNDTASLRARATLGLQQLQSSDRVDVNRIAVIGFCFGGTTALELARSGAAVAGTVSIHGGLGSDTPSDANNIKGRVLVLHGADDPYVPQDEVSGFMLEMRNADVDWQMISYGGAVHAFTQKSAGNDPSGGAAYEQNAAARSWQHMLTFFHEVFGGKGKQGKQRNPWT
jgi:dienelactone hydrolase